MEQLTDLKAILHSKRANIYYLEMCRVMQKDGRVLYLSEAKKEYQYWNIPIVICQPYIILRIKHSKQPFYFVT